MLTGLMKYIPKFGAVMLAGYLGWVGWLELGPRKPEIGPVRQKMANQAVNKIAEDLRKNRGDVYNAILLHFANDPSDYFTKKLRSALEQRGILDLEDRSFTEKVRNKLNLRHSICKTDAEAIEIGKNAEIKGVLYGRIKTFESFSGGAKIDIEYTLINTISGKVVYSGEYVYDSSKSIGANLASAEMQEQTQSIPGYLRLLGWVLIVLLLPIFTISFIRTMLAKRSNSTNFFVLSIYTIIDTVLAFLMVGATLASTWTVIIFCCAIAAAFMYNISIMSFALKLEE